MAKKYTYSRTIFTPDGNPHQFTAVEFDSFEEAIKAVDKGIYDFKLVLVPQGAGLMGSIDPGFKPDPIKPEVVVLSDSKKDADENKEPSENLNS